MRFIVRAKDLVFSNGLAHGPVFSYRVSAKQLASFHYWMQEERQQACGAWHYL
jgi:hypothetical protein